MDIFLQSNGVDRKSAGCFAGHTLLSYEGRYPENFALVKELRTERYTALASESFNCLFWHLRMWDASGYPPRRLQFLLRLLLHRYNKRTIIQNTI
jgi:hypothetical protein